MVSVKGYVISALSSNLAGCNNLGQQSAVSYYADVCCVMFFGRMVYLQIERFKAVGTAKKGRSELVRENLICRDISKGKENLPVVVHNEVRHKRGK